MLGGADNPNGELPSYITGANNSEAGQRPARLDLSLLPVNQHGKEQDCCPLRSGQESFQQ